MSDLVNIRDLADTALSPQVRTQVETFVRRGFSRDHLVVSETGRIYFDKELAENDAFDEIFLGPRAADP